MSEARFMLATTSSAELSAALAGMAMPEQSVTASGIAWRLIAGNNHGLGRGPHSYPDVPAAVAAVEFLLRELDRAEIIVAPTSRPPGGWVWRLRIDGKEQAVSSRVHQRQRESRYNVQQFLAAASAAPAPPAIAVVRQRVVRRGHPVLGPHPQVVS